MIEDEYGNVLIGLAGAPISIRSVVSFLREADDARVISGETLLRLRDVPNGLTVVPGVSTFKQKNHLMGVKGYLLWLPYPEKESEKLLSVARERREKIDSGLYSTQEFDSSDCHMIVDMDSSWKRRLSSLLAAFQYRSVDRQD